MFICARPRQEKVIHMKQTIRTIFAALLGIYCYGLRAAVPASALSVEVRQSDSQQKEYTTKRASGDHDFTVSKTRSLTIKCQVATPTSHPLKVRWFFIARDKLNSRNGVWSSGEKDIVAGRVGFSFVAESEPLEQGVYTKFEGVNGIRTTSSTSPHGWAVEVLSDGRVIKTVESSNGLLAQLRKKSR